MDDIKKLTLHYKNGRTVNIKKALCFDLSDDKHLDIIYKDVEFNDIQLVIAYLKRLAQEVREDDETGEENYSAV